MNVDNKFKYCFLALLIITQLMLTAASAETEFYLYTANSGHKGHCDYVEIKAEKVACTENDIVVTYNLNSVDGIEIVRDGKSLGVNRIDQDKIIEVNSLNSAKLKFRRLDNDKRAEGGFLKSDFGAQLSSISSFSDASELLKYRYGKKGVAGILSICLFLAGAVAVVIGNFWFIINTFRVHVFWGLGCLFLPFISLIFLFVHWKSAARPFVLSFVGIISVILGVFLGDSRVSGRERPVKARPVASSAVSTEKGRYSCSGKIHCSQMTSCAEAKFYLRNCPGTKMDGDGDGIPCESQWCGR